MEMGKHSNSQDDEPKRVPPENEADSLRSSDQSDSNQNSNELGHGTVDDVEEAGHADNDAEYDIDAKARKDAPGVYVESKKIASVGLRIRRGSSFHGMALNIDVDLAPFSCINPCGFSNLEVTDLAALGIPANGEAIRTAVEKNLLGHLGLQNE